MLWYDSKRRRYVCVVTLALTAFVCVKVQNGGAVLSLGGRTAPFNYLDIIADSFKKCRISVDHLCEVFAHVITICKGALEGVPKTKAGDSCVRTSKSRQPSPLGFLFAR